jgi:hypothetical protein
LKTVFGGDLGERFNDFVNGLPESQRWRHDADFVTGLRITVDVIEIVGSRTLEKVAD